LLEKKSKQLNTKKKLFIYILGSNLLYTTKFSLQSIISYIGDVDVKIIGHYVTHCKRIKSYWGIHNNLLKDEQYISVQNPNMWNYIYYFM
jgi:hypothetical protein